ncbi:MAG TPA: helix-turn-helix domain-containing protein [Candidatus Eremiobacteraceae bacterium]|nr:helix-turn-helix domain-containing protein [Candidatus Eremiobacteraceae bacterium]
MRRRTTVASPDCRKRLGRVTSFGARVGDERRTESPFLTVAETAACLKVSRQTVRNLIELGLLPVVRLSPLGRRILTKKLDEMAAGGSLGMLAPRVDD